MGSILCQLINDAIISLTEKNISITPKTIIQELIDKKKIPKNSLNSTTLKQIENIIN